MSDNEMPDSQIANPGTPPKLREQYNKAKRDLLPTKSGDLYKKSYADFVKWQEENNTTSRSPRVLLSYFSYMAEIRAPSTLWSEYSKLKSTLQLNHGIDIGQYNEVIKFLKKNSKGYEPKKALAFTALQVQDFLQNAGDAEYLFEKAALTIGLLGACRREELTKMTTDDLELFYSDKDREHKNPMLIVRIPKSKNGLSRSFIVKGEFYQIVRRYGRLRPEATPHNRFFINYQKGQCTKQPVGINKMGVVPLTVAKFLGLPDAERYTSHTIRHTGASLFVEGGGTMEDLRRLGGWKSDAVAAGYVTQAKSTKEKIADKITGTIVLPSTSTSTTSSGSSATSINLALPSISASTSSSGSSGTSTNLTFVEQLRRLRSTRPSPNPSTANTSTSDCAPGPSSPAADKENMMPIENLMGESKIHVNVSNCQNCTFTIAEPKDA